MVPLDGLFEIVETNMTAEQIRQDYRDCKIGYDTAIYLLRSYHNMTEVEADEFLFSGSEQ